MKSKSGGSLGKRICELRKQKGMTQEMLSNSIHVSVQAISKWECGGTPDTLLLPNIADALGVTIESLYSQTEEDVQDIKEIIGVKMMQTLECERDNKTFEMCKALHLGFLENPINSSKSVFNDTKLAYSDQKNNYYSMINTRQGVSIARIKKDSEYFFIMPEDEEGFSHSFTTGQEYIKFFKMLSKPNYLKTILFFYSHALNKFTLKALSQELGIKKTILHEILEELTVHMWLWVVDVETENGIIKTYQISTNDALLFMLYTAQDMMQGMQMYLCFHNSRELDFQKPLFDSLTKAKLYK